MIRVDFLYKVKTSDLPEMLDKFKESGSEKFASTPSNIKIEMALREKGNDTLISLNIYYNSLADYKERTKFEQSHPEWLAIWFKDSDIFTLEHREIYKVQV